MGLVRVTPPIPGPKSQALLERRKRAVAPGVSLAHPRLFDRSPEGAFSLNAVWDTAIAAGRAFGLRMEGTWMHVGTPEALAQAEQRLAEAAGV